MLPPSKFIHTSERRCLTVYANEQTHYNLTYCFGTNEDVHQLVRYISEEVSSIIKCRSTE